MHKLLLHPAAPGLAYQQNHGGIYRSDDYGDSWYAIHQGLEQNYGFGLALDPHDKDTCYVVPLEPKNYAFRATLGAFRVFRWNGGGRGWKTLGRGLPAHGAYLNVLREGMASDSCRPCGIYVGTGTGQIFHSADAGRSWRPLALYLPPVLSVSAAVV